MQIEKGPLLGPFSICRVMNWIRSLDDQNSWFDERAERVRTASEALARRARRQPSHPSLSAMQIEKGPLLGPFSICRVMNWIRSLDDQNSWFDERAERVRTASEALARRARRQPGHPSLCAYKYKWGHKGPVIN